MFHSYKWTASECLELYRIFEYVKFLRTEKMEEGQQKHENNMKIDDVKSYIK